MCEMEVHPTYGRRVASRGEAAALFPGGATGGVKLLPNGHVGSIFIDAASGSGTRRHTNTIEKDVIYYAHTTHVRAHRAMEAAFEQGQTIPVQIGDGGTLGFFWGQARIEAMMGPDARLCYVLKRVQQTPEEEAAELEKAPVVDPEQLFDSLLERRHAALMSELSVSFSRSNVPCYKVELSDGVHSYTPDFLLYTADGAAQVIEIKPCYPHDDELRRCEQVCRKARSTVFLMYGGTFTPPFSSRKRTRDELPTYPHADGVRGIKFSWCNTTEGVVMEGDAGYYVDAEGRAGIDVRRVIGDGRFENERLQQAFAAAAKVTGP